MGIFTGVLLVSDFDGTIFGSKTGLPETNIKAAQGFIDEGGIFAIATGRTYVTFAPQYPLIPSNAPTILSNGACVYDFQKNIPLKMQNLPISALKDLQTLADEMPELAMEVYHAEDIYVHNPNEITDKHMEIVGSTYKIKALDQIPTPWLKVLIQQDHKTLVKAREKLQKISPDTYETIFSNPKYLEITDKGVNKGSAVLELAKSYNIAPEHIYCMGDNENDLPMMDIAKAFFSPSSSANVVLEKNPQMVCSCKEGALAHVIDILSHLYAEEDDDDYDDYDDYDDDDYDYSNFLVENQDEAK